ncbi:MAG TPA: hypothetical protein HA350_05305 [Candidatus Nitrosotenuis sp.]|jgi:ribosomal protein L29|nr:hypothetical protein [Candidatus Nitrosotenuis sp.]
MIELERYLRGLLNQVHASYLTLDGLSDKPGDLETIRRALAKINGTLLNIGKKIDTNQQELENYQYLKSPIRNYLENHEFFREMETMSTLYSEDPMRLRNLRLSIIDALSENNLLAHINSIVREQNE